MTTQLLKTLLENEALDREFVLDTYNDIIRACSGGNIRNFDTAALNFLLFVYFSHEHEIAQNGDGVFSLDYIMKNGSPEDVMEFFKKIPVSDFPEQIASFSPDGKMVEVLSCKPLDNCFNILSYEREPEITQQIPKFHVERCEVYLVTLLSQDHITFGQCGDVHVTTQIENFRDLRKLANPQLFESIDVVIISSDSLLSRMMQNHKLDALLKPCLERARIDHNTEFRFGTDWSSVKKRENVS